MTEPADLVLRIAAADPASEALTVLSDGAPVEVVELTERMHYLAAPAGKLTVTDEAGVRLAVAGDDVTGDLPSDDHTALVSLA